MFDERRRMMMAGGRWAKEPLIVYDGTKNTTNTSSAITYINLNNGYADKDLTETRVDTIIGRYKSWETDGSWSVFLKDVKKYKTLKITYKNLDDAGDDYYFRHFGIVKDSKYGTTASSLDENNFAVYTELSGEGTSYTTVSIDIEALSGRKQLAMNAVDYFDASGVEPGITVIRIWMEGE